MFRSLFLEKGEDDDDDDLTPQNNRLISLMDEGARTVPPASITSWAVGELSQGLAKVAEVTDEFSTENSPHYFSPLEEIGRDCGRLEKELTREHVRLYKENIKLSGEVDAAAKDRTALNQSVVSCYKIII
jgi:hypothetical protein